jgi:hypothetical protein
LRYSKKTDCGRDRKAASPHVGMIKFLGLSLATPPSRQRDFERIQPNLGIDHRNGAVDAVSVRFPKGCGWQLTARLARLSESPIASIFQK